MNCAATTACVNETFDKRANRAVPAAKPGSVVRLAGRATRAQAGTPAPWTRSEFAAVLGSTLTAVTLGSLLAFELATKLQAPTIF